MTPTPFHCDDDLSSEIVHVILLQIATYVLRLITLCHIFKILFNDIDSPINDNQEYAKSTTGYRQQTSRHFHVKFWSN